MASSDFFNDHPTQDTGASCQHGCDECHNRGLIDCQSRANIKAKPANPKKCHPDECKNDIMRRHRCSWPTLTSAKYISTYKCSNTRVDMNSSSTSKVQHSPIMEQGTFTAPDHMVDWCINNN